MADLDAINRELTEIVDRLNELPRDALAERHALGIRQDELRQLADRFREDVDDSRSTAELEAELAARRSQLDALYDIVQNQGTVDETTPVSGQLLEAQGSGAIHARITKIESVLATRDDRAPTDGR